MLGGNTASAQARKQSIVQSQAEDDKNIRFTIGGVGQRMTKDDFLREVQKLGPKTRKEVVEQSDAPQNVKKIAKLDISPEQKAEAAQIRQPAAGSGFDESAAISSASPARRSQPSGKAKPSEELGETAVERKRRLAVLSTQGEEEETGETPAERRRREAALSVGGAGDDSDDEGGLRVPPERRGITFAEPTRAGRSQQ